MEKTNKKLTKKKRSKIWQWLCVLLGLGFLIYPYRKQIKKQISQPVNRFALILNEECKYLPEKILTMRSRMKIYLKDFFIPSSSNNHKPHGLSTKVLKIYAVVLILIKLITVGFLFFTYPSPAVLSQKISQEIFDLTNISRSTENLNELNWNNQLALAAQAKANDMVANNYFAHISPDGKQPWEWIDKGGYYFLYMGENLAMDFSSAKIAHSAFQQSPTHWKNIMNPKYLDMGVGVAVGNINGRETIVLVEFFGAQKIVQPIIPVAQANEETTLAAATTPSAPSQNLTEPEVVVTKTTPPVQESTPVTAPVTASVQQTTEIVDPIPVTTPEPVLELIPEIVTESVDEPVEIIIPDPQPQPLVAEIIIPEEINLADNPVVVASTNESIEKSLVEYIIIFSRYALLLFLAILSVMLLINILVHPHIQHSKVIFQSLGVILLISTLLLTKFHFVEQIQHVLIF
jgi:uncharacterized protein YkwD